MWLRVVAALAFLMLGAGAAVAQAPPAGSAPGDVVFQTRDLEFRTLDLVFRIENIGGQVLALQVKETATETRIELPADILFDFDKSDIRPTAETALKQAADVIRKGARGTVRIEGHTDSKGTPGYNQKLSERRSTSVQQWLVQREGLIGIRFAIKGFGASKPVAPNTKPDGSDDPEGRQNNRRVEIVFARR